MSLDWNSLYNDPGAYDRQVGEDPLSVGFFTQLAKACGGPVLELACGTGRITIPIAQAGVEVVGLDLSEPMLRKAREKADQAGVSIEWVCRDFRDFSLGRKFKLIFIAFHSIHHATDLESVQAILTRIREHLDDEGLLVIEDWNPAHPDYGSGDHEKPEYQVTMSSNRVTTSERDRQFNYFYPREYELLLDESGFKIEKISGDLDGRDYALDSQRLIVSAKCVKSLR